MRTLDSLLLLRCMAVLVCSMCSHKVFSITDDQEKHVIFSSVLGVSSSMMTQNHPLSYGFCLGAGALKELYDESQYRNAFSWSDMAFNLVGCTLGTELMRLAWHQLELSPTLIDGQPSFQVKWSW